jgi:hypothetical protein
MLLLCILSFKISHGRFFFHILTIIRNLVPDDELYVGDKQNRNLS